MGIIDTTAAYGHSALAADIKCLKYEYPEICVGSIGKSCMSRDLFYMRLGHGRRKVFINAAHHALEWITTVAAMKFAEDFMAAYYERRKIGSFNIAEIFNNTSIYIVPLINPDGVDIVLNGITNKNPNYNNLIKWNGDSGDFSRTWQANNNGVDLNHNYDALWELGKEMEPENGVFGPGPTRFSGCCPESEPESRAAANFSRSMDFDMAIALHSQGEVIYWKYDDCTPEKSAAIAKKLASVSGYELDETEGMASYSGYKDWFIKEYRRPAFTVEVGLGTNPLPIEQFDEIYVKVLPLLLTACE